MTMRTTTIAVPLLLLEAAAVASADAGGAGDGTGPQCAARLAIDPDQFEDSGSPAARATGRRCRVRAAAERASMPAPVTLRVATVPAVAVRRGALCIVLGLASCTTPPEQRPPSDGARHETGSSFVDLRGYYGIPILRKSFFWDGEGEVDDSGIGVRTGTYLSEQFAVGVGSNLATWWVPGADVYSIELEALVRVHPVHDWPLFVNGTAGYQLANSQIPPGGTVWNFTFSWGAGFEFPVGSATNLITGVDYHHISNALGRENDRNPSQNEARFWVGIEWIF